MISPVFITTAPFGTTAIWEDSSPKTRSSLRIDHQARRHSRFGFAARRKCRAFPHIRAPEAQGDFRFSILDFGFFLGIEWTGQPATALGVIAGLLISTSKIN
jgi:hypothetical protein